jgi:molecular chaperone DnaJ
MEQFAAESEKSGKQSPESDGFFARVKEFFDASRD